MNQTDIEPIVTTGDPDVDSFNADPQAKEGRKPNPDWVDAYQDIQIRLTAAEREQAAIIAHGLLAGHPDNPVQVGPRPVIHRRRAAIDREFAGIQPYFWSQSIGADGVTQNPQNTSGLPQWGQV